MAPHTATVQQDSQAHTDTEHHTELVTELGSLDVDTDTDTEQEPLVAITKCDGILFVCPYYFLSLRCCPIIVTLPRLSSSTHLPGLFEPYPQ